MISSSSASSGLFATDEERWRALRTRDSAADGAFVYSVRTTRVYCRPSCPSRPARPENVAFHASPAEAARAGFRSCKRCRPDGLTKRDEQLRSIQRACRLLDRVDDEVPNLEDLSAEAGLSPFHFHRLFKAALGVTPKAYAAARRRQRVRQELDGTTRVTDALYSAGFGSASRFYETAPAMLGMAPKAYQGGGVGSLIRFALGECSLGSFLVAATDKGVVAVQFGEDPELLVNALQDRFPAAELAGGDPGFEALVSRVVAAVEEPSRAADLPLDVRGTAFQERVWRELRQIPAGSTASYGDVAANLGVPTATRAVAQACAANQIAVLIPCHRVVRKDGAVGGYRWGVERKRSLLDREVARA